MVADTFPRQYARTQRLTLGEARTITAGDDCIVFLRASGGDDPIHALWVLDAAGEHLVADPRELLDQSPHTESAEERSRRERAREGAQGIVSYACDANHRIAAFVLGGNLVVADLVGYTSRLIDIVSTSAEPLFDPRPNHDGTRIAYTRGNALFVTDMDGNERMLASEDASTVKWGQAEFIAAEEMGRSRGHWWSHDGMHLAATRVDEDAVTQTWIADPTHPEAPPRAHRYPFAGSANAHVTLHIISLDDGTTTSVTWDHSSMPYLARVSWTQDGLVIATQSRDQRTLDIFDVDPATGATTLLHRETDDHWVELVPGSPTRINGDLIYCGERNGVRALVCNTTTLTPPTMQVRAIVDATPNTLHFLANDLDNPTSQHVWRLDRPTNTLVALTTQPGVHSTAISTNTVVIRRADLDTTRATTTVTARFSKTPVVLANHAETPLVTPNVQLHRVGERQIATAILTPHNHDGSTLPVLFDPYGGPHAQRVVSSRAAFVASQWFADQGFVVVVADGRGTPARGTAWERAVAGDLAAPVLEDQLAVLDALPMLCAFADTSRVAIRGWSFGGYLAALAVLRAPTRFHAGIAGAPVTDWGLYDTHYTERYLGHPQHDAANYHRTSLLNDAHLLAGKLLLIHGLADDNVLAAHTLQLSASLLAHGKPHHVLPLSGVSHMTPQEVIAENLLLHQLAFLRESLG